MPDTPPLDLLALGRISVDLYAQEPGASFLDPQTFVKSIGGSPTNVAVAAARLGLQSAVVTAVGADPLGQYAVTKLKALGVHTRYVTVRDDGRTPVVLVALDDPAEPTNHRGGRARGWHPPSSRDARRRHRDRQPRSAPPCQVLEPERPASCP